MRVASILLSLLVLSACGLPPAYSLANFAIASASYLMTGKSVSDNALSILTARDCEVFRVLAEQDIKALCRPKEERTATAASEQVEPSAFAAALASPTIAVDESLVAAVYQPLAGPQEPVVLAAPTPAAGEVRSSWQPVAEELPDELPNEPSGEPPAPANVRGTFLVAGSFLVVDNAVHLASRIATFDVSLIPTEIGGETFVRVVVGPFSAEEIGPARAYLGTTGVLEPWAITLCAQDLRMPPCEPPIWQAAAPAGSHLVAVGKTYSAD